MSFHVGLPQGLWLAAWAVGMAMKFHLNGKPVSSKVYNATGPVLVSLASIGLLVWGGFFS